MPTLQRSVPLDQRKRVRRFKVEYDPHVTCCCSIEEHASGEYVLLEDYINLLREHQEQNKDGKEDSNDA